MTKKSHFLRRRDVLALLCAMTFPSLMSWIEFWLLPGVEQGHGRSLGIVFALGKVVQFAFPLVYVWMVEPEALSLAKPHTRGLGLAIGFAMVIVAGMCGVYFLVLKHSSLFEDTPEKLATLLANFHSNTPAVFFAMAAFISVLHSLLEEYYWRWFVFGRLERYLPVTAAIAISSLAFMAHHVFVLAYYFPGRFWIATVPFSLGDMSAQPASPSVTRAAAIEACVRIFM